MGIGPGGENRIVDRIGECYIFYDLGPVDCKGSG